MVEVEANLDENCFHCARCQSLFVMQNEQLVGWTCIMTDSYVTCTRIIIVENRIGMNEISQKELCLTVSTSNGINMQVVFVHEAIINLPPHTHTHARTCARTHIHASRHTYKHIHTRKHTHTHTNTLTHIRMHAHTHTRARTHACTHTCARHDHQSLGLETLGTVTNHWGEKEMLGLITNHWGETDAIGLITNHWGETDARLDHQSLG